MLRRAAMRASTRVTASRAIRSRATIRARAMAEGALARSRAGLTVAVTGVAGPGGGSAEKPVGLVHFGCALDGGETYHHRAVFPGDRSAVRQATVRTALEMLLSRL